MDLQEMATQMFMDKIGGNVDAGAAGQALSKLIGEGSEFDLGGLLSQLSSSGLANAAQSWLGDGANQAISAADIMHGLGPDKIADLASQLGLGQEDAAGGLAAMIPDLIDQSSKGGSLLDAVGGLASQFLK